MRSSRSFLTFLYYLTFLSFVFAHVSIDVSTPVSRSDIPHRALSNAERLARGLPLKKPELQDPTRRYTAQIVKRSSIPGEPETFNIAMQKTSTDLSGLRKRASTVGWATVVEGQLSYTDSVELAAKFVWAAFIEGEMRALKWIPDDSQGVYQEGVAYAMQALKESGAWSTRFSALPADAASKFLSQVSDTVFSPTFDSDTTSKPTDFIWVVDSSGQIHFAPDVSTAIALYPGCSVAVAQVIVPGDPATVEAALGFQSTALTSAGRLYVLSNDGVSKWVSAGDDSVMTLTSDATAATTFYFPNLGTTSPQKMLFQQYEQTSTVILSDETAVASHLAGMTGSTTPALFSIPINGKGIITTSVASSLWNFYTDSAIANDLTLCSSATSCGANFKPICVELVPNGAQPFACEAARPKGSEKWMYATHVVGYKKGWIGVNAESQRMEWAVDDSTTQPATFIVPSQADAATQPLDIKINGEYQTVRLAKNSQGSPDSLALSTYPTDEYEKEYVETSSSAHISITSDGFVKTPSGASFYTYDWQYPLEYCEGNAQCQYAHEPVCVELVNVGGTPSKCLAQMQAKIAKNPRKIYAVSEDNSFEGWLKNDGGMFKAISTDKTGASPFYAPYLGNGSVAQELFAEFNGGYNSWWGPHIHDWHGPDFGFGRFGIDPGTTGSEYGVPFNMTNTGIGLLTADPNWDFQRFSGMSFYYNAQDTLLYLADSMDNAKKMMPNPVKVCLETVDASDDSMPSACKAAQPVKRWLWAAHADGSNEGWIGYSTEVGPTGGLKWSIPESPTDTRTFYVPSSPSGLSMLSVNMAAVGETEVIQPVGLVNDWDNRKQFSPVASTENTALFNLPSDSLGIVTLAPGSFFWTAPWFEPIYTCGETGCGSTGGPFQMLCLELVAVGGTPSACAAQAKAKIEQNPTVLYAATSDGKVTAYARTGAGGVLTLDGTAITGNTFYVPGLNNGTTAQDTYTKIGNLYGKFWGNIAYNGDYRTTGFTRIQVGAPQHYSYEMPVVYSSTQDGIISPSNTFYDDWLTPKYFINYADLSLNAFSSLDSAVAALGSNVAEVCIESVKLGETPGKCAESFPRQSGPSYLYAVGDGGADAGYVSVNQNTGRITWARTPTTTNAAIFYVDKLGSTSPQELFVQVQSDKRPLHAPSTATPQFIGSTNTTLRPAALFSIPTSGAGVVTPQGLGFYTSALGFPVYGCTDINCGTMTVQSSICVELVPAGSAPSACLAQALANTAKNPMVLYARSADGSVNGYVKASSTGMTPYGTTGEATTFYAPTYGNGSAQHDTYASSSGTYSKIWTSLFNAPSAQRIVSTTKLVLGRSTSSGANMVPLVYPSSSVYGAVTPYNQFFATGNFASGTLQFYVNRDATDRNMYAAVTDGDAEYIGTDVVRVCVESVPVGGSPRVCAAPSPRKRGPQRLNTNA